MSLFIGNLSARTSVDDLQNVFWRFGRCNLQLKDGYGFVVYDFVQDAEKALRELRGRNICGEFLTLTWSNKQPKSLHRHLRGMRSYELQRGRNFSSGGDYGSKRSSNAWRDHRFDNNQPDVEGRRLNSKDMLDEDRGGRQEDIKDYNRDYHGFRSLPVDSDSVVPKLVDTGRWGEQVHDPSNANGVDDGVEFDQYEPYQGHDRKDEDENHHMEYFGDGSAPRSSQENVRRKRFSYTTLNHSNDLKLRNTCFSCGGEGHKIRNCPRKYSSARKFTRFDRRQDDASNERSRSEAELERFESRSSGKLQLSKDTASRHRSDSTSSGSGKHQRLINYGSSPVRKESNRTEIKDHGGKKRSRREGESPKRHSGKRARRSVSSSLHSDNHASKSKSKSRSTSQSSKSVSSSRSQSRSRPISRGAHSLSSNSRSSSKSKSLKSRSRSSSTISLSVSPSQSPFSVCKANTLKSKEMVEHIQSIEGDAFIENGDAENTVAVVKSNHAVLGFEVEDDMKDDQALQRNDDDDNHTTSRSVYEVTNPGTPTPVTNPVINTVVVVKSNHAVSGFEVEADMKDDQPLQRNDDDDNHNTSRSVYEVTNPGTPLPEMGAHTAGNLIAEGLRDMLDLQNSGAPVKEQMAPQTKDPTSETPVNYYTGCSTCISSDEMCRVLKHYGLELPEESEQHVSVEGYFGSARLWPWEIIYYRRLKKGLISVENYARRVAQNQEFGIVDKYIRSSSGWGEIDQENP